MPAHVIDTQDRLEHRSGLDEPSEVYGVEPGQPIPRQLKSFIGHLLRRSPRLAGQLPHHVVLATYKMKGPLPAERCQQSASVSESFA